MTAAHVPEGRIALSWRDVLAMVPFSKRALQMKISRREFPQPVHHGGKALFDRAEVLAWWERVKKGEQAEGAA